MRNVLDFSSWQALLSTLFGLAVFSLVVVGIRLVIMQIVQKRRERENRQINERLRTLIAAYKTLGGSFTGNLVVHPTHRRDLRAQEASRTPHAASGADDTESSDRGDAPGSERRRRIRDAVEAALSDIILLGTEEQVRLAVQAANDMVANRPIETAELVVSLRAFIREALDLEPVPQELVIPRQGPVRPSGAGPRRGDRDERAGRGASERGGGAAAGAAGLGLGAGVARAAHENDSHHSDSP